jgi:hypothetical protein
LCGTAALTIALELETTSLSYASTSLTEVLLRRWGVRIEKLLKECPSIQRGDDKKRKHMEKCETYPSWHVSGHGTLALQEYEGDEKMVKE